MRWREARSEFRGRTSEHDAAAAASSEARRQRSLHPASRHVVFDLPARRLSASGFLFPSDVWVKPAEQLSRLLPWTLALTKR